MSKIESIVAYRTSDGMIYTERPVAVRHERYLAFCELYHSPGRPLALDVEADVLFEWLMACRQKFTTILSA